MKRDYTKDQVFGYLRMKGIPPTMVQALRQWLAEDAVQEAEYLHWDRIFTMFASALRETYGFGAERILRCLQTANEIMGDISYGKYTWRNLGEKLKEDTGLVVRTGDDDRVIIEVGDEE